MSALYGTYARSDLAFERGEGMRLYDQHGRDYLDFHSGIAVNALGYQHPRIVKALREESRSILHVSNLFYHPAQGLLAQLLAFLCVSNIHFQVVTDGVGCRACGKQKHGYKGKEGSFHRLLGVRGV